MVIFGRGIILLSKDAHIGMWSYKNIMVQIKVENNFPGSPKRGNSLISLPILSSNPKVGFKSFLSPDSYPRTEDLSPRA